jgi:hypothetical protein
VRRQLLPPRDPPRRRAFGRLFAFRPFSTAGSSSVTLVDLVIMYAAHPAELQLRRLNCTARLRETRNTTDIIYFVIIYFIIRYILNMTYLFI